MPAITQSIGIDLGLTHFAILSNGKKIDNPRFHKTLLKRIKKANKKLSKCQKGSNRRKKAKLKLAKLHAKIKDSRTDFLHKLTTRLVRENQALAIEDLNVSGLVKNRKLSRAISDAGWYSWRVLLDAKCQKYNRVLAVINRWEATSQKCHICGNSGGKKELDVREWQCIYCGANHDRDINAALNILVAAVALRDSIADVGGSVRPVYWLFPLSRQPPFNWNLRRSTAERMSNNKCFNPCKGFKLVLTQSTVI